MKYPLVITPEEHARRVIQRNAEEELYMPTFTLLPIAFADGSPVPGHYFKSFDHEANDGQGHAVFTNDPAEALTFPSHAAAFEFWRRQSTVRPFRPDGKPNRPMTCTTVEVGRIAKVSAF